MTFNLWKLCAVGLDGQRRLVWSSSVLQMKTWLLSSMSVTKQNCNSSAEAPLQQLLTFNLLWWQRPESRINAMMSRLSRPTNQKGRYLRYLPGRGALLPIPSGSSGLRRPPANLVGKEHQRAR